MVLGLVTGTGMSIEGGSGLVVGVHCTDDSRPLAMMKPGFCMEIAWQHWSSDRSWAGCGRSVTLTFPIREVDD